MDARSWEQDLGAHGRGRSPARPLIEINLGKFAPANTPGTPARAPVQITTVQRPLWGLSRPIFIAREAIKPVGYLSAL